MAKKRQSSLAGGWDSSDPVTDDMQVGVDSTQNRQAFNRLSA
jgi:hypothetical protein